MARNIFTVVAHIIDANGTFNYLDGYPKKFDSNSYDGDVDKAKKRAEGEAASVWSSMCKRDDRQLQNVFMYDMYGLVVVSPKTDIAKETPSPSPSPSPEPEGETEGE